MINLPPISPETKAALTRSLIKLSTQGHEAVQALLRAGVDPRSMSDALRTIDATLGKVQALKTASK